MVAVALIGADGAGKTSLARALEHSTEPPIRYLYMGVSRQASNVALPTTRAVGALRRGLGLDAQEGGPPDSERRRARPGGLLRRGARSARARAALANRVCEEGYRTMVMRRLERRGFLVLLDRLFYADYWAHDVVAVERTGAQRVHARFLRRLPLPDCTILLDAPATVLFARKPEGRLEWIARRRLEYLAFLRTVENSHVVDATRSSAEVQAEVLAILRALWRARGGAR